MNAAWNPYCVQVLVELIMESPSSSDVLVKDFVVGHGIGLILGGGSGCDVGGIYGNYPLSITTK